MKDKNEKERYVLIDREEFQNNDDLEEVFIEQKEYKDAEIENIELSKSQSLRNDSTNSGSIALSNISVSSCSDINTALDRNTNLLNIACANARSVVEKIDSVITLFEENSLHIAILTETWLSSKHCPPRVLADLTVGANLNFIRRDRGSRGGGVAICYDPTRIRMNGFSTGKNESKCEVVCAVGNCTLTKRKIAALTVYLPPNIDANKLAASLQIITDTIDKLLSKYVDPIILLGGDFNNKNLAPITDMFKELKPILAGATRNGVSLDEVYTNVAGYIKQKEILHPLCKSNGTPVIIVS